MRLASRHLILACAAVFAVAVALAWPRIAPAETRTVDIAIKHGKVAGAKSVRVTQGETVILRWTSDRALELHLHGYDIEAEVGPGKPAEMKIDARATGRFPVEVHAREKSHGDKSHGEKAQRGKSGGGHGHHALFHLEVYPK